MNTPDVPLRLEIAVDVPGSPEQVWDALATANGSSAWFLPTDVEERAGGAICFHMGPDVSSEGHILEWEPPRRLVYEEPDWAELSGHDSASVTPLVTEYLVEARSGGTCSVRIVSSAFGTGDAWEQEFFDEMEAGWRPFFEHLRLYLTHFAGERVTGMLAATRVEGGDIDAIRAALSHALGAPAIGGTIECRGLRGVAERVGPAHVLLRVVSPIRGYVGFAIERFGEMVALQMAAYFFADDAPAYVDREQPGWQAWLDTLGAPAFAEEH
jgi:uncharacterized protein YndB with AHSA1/START domain